MAVAANVLMAGAMGAGYAGLTSRQCWMALLALYSGGLNANAVIAGAAAAGYQSLSDRQLDQCLLQALQP